MVFTLTTPAKESYLLWHRFTMPIESGTHDAVAVPASVGHQLVSAYTFLLGHIIIFTWGIVVILSVLGALRWDGHHHPRSPLHKQIFSKRSSPVGVMQLAAKKFLESKSTRWIVSLWILVALAWVTVNYAVPIIFAPYILLGNAAPVNPDAIFVPSRNNTGSFSDSSNKDNLKIFDYYVPSALRAVGGIDSLNGTDRISPSLQVDPPENMGVDNNGGLLLRIGYRYNVSGLDFGLQDYPDLLLSVEGACTTEYNWWAGQSYDDPAYPGAFVEEYIPFNMPNLTQVVSAYDGGPRAFFFANPPDISPTNSTWAAIISSVNRTSWFPSTDPWYLTAPNEFYNSSSQSVIAPYMVASQRPALSCWENDVWFYQGHNGSVLDLGSMPGLDMPSGLTTIFIDSLGLPMIYLLGTYLQVSALKSSVSALSNILDANSSSIYSDLQRLVFASYIATVNCLTETTMFSAADGFPNDIAPDGSVLPGAGKFVIYSENVATLSVRALIVIPVLTVVLWILSTALFVMPLTAKTLGALKASDPEEEKDSKSRLSKMAGGFAGVVLGAALSFAKSETDA
jgi:hypothetical protein